MYSRISGTMWFPDLCTMHFGPFEGDVKDHIMSGVYGHRGRCYQPVSDACRRFEGDVIARSVADAIDLSSRISGPHFAGSAIDCRGLHIDWRHEVISSFWIKTGWMKHEFHEATLSRHIFLISISFAMPHTSLFVQHIIYICIYMMCVSSAWRF